MKKVAIVFSRYNPPYLEGGIETYISNQAKYLLQKGYKINVFVMNDGKKYIDECDIIRKIKVPNIVILSTIIFSFKLRFQLQEFELINVHYPTLAVFFKPNHVVYTIHTFPSEEEKHREGGGLIRKLKYYQKKLFEYYAYKKGCYFICLNDQIKKSLSCKYQKKSMVIGNGIDIQKFKYQKIEDLGRNEPLRLLYLGRLITRKNIETLVRAVMEMNTGLITLDIAGVGYLENRLKEIVNNNTSKTQIRFIGYKTGSELLEAYKNCHIYVLPSFYEGLPFTVLEAMSIGRPVLLGNFEAASHLVGDNKQGVIVKKNTIRFFIEGVEYFLKNREKIGSMSINARNMIEEKYANEIAMKKMMKVFEQLKC